MRLTKKIDMDKGKPNYYEPSHLEEYSTKNKHLAINKLGKLEDIEQELGIDLVSLFDSKYTGNRFEIEIEDDKTIFFDGDSYYGHYSAEQFLQLIKDMLSMYKQLIKIGCKRKRN